MAVWEMLSTCLPREFMEDIATSTLEDVLNEYFIVYPTAIDILLSLTNRSNITDHVDTR